MPVDVLGVITYIDIPRQRALKKRERVATIRDAYIKDLRYILLNLLTI